MSKYNNHKSHGFDSKKEERRYYHLLTLERSGEITDLHRQVPFELIPIQREPDAIGPRGGVTKGKVIERACYYVADFTYKRDGVQVVEDSKGYRTADYRIKKKLMLYVHGIRILET